MLTYSERQVANN